MASDVCDLCCYSCNSTFTSASFPAVLNEGGERCCPGCGSEFIELMDPAEVSPHPAVRAEAPCCSPAAREAPTFQLLLGPPRRGAPARRPGAALARGHDVIRLASLTRAPPASARLAAQPWVVAPWTLPRRPASILLPRPQDAPPRPQPAPVLGMPGAFPGAPTPFGGLPHLQQQHTYAGPDGSNVSVHVSTATVPGSLFDMLSNRIGNRMNVAGNDALVVPLNVPFRPFDLFSEGCATDRPGPTGT
jgi:hypothetical protein